MPTAAKLSKPMATIPEREYADFCDRQHAPFAERANEQSGCTWPPADDARRTEEVWLSYGMQDRPGGVAKPTDIEHAILAIQLHHSDRS